MTDAIRCCQIVVDWDARDKRRCWPRGMRIYVIFALFLIHILDMKRSTPGPSPGQDSPAAALQQQQTRQREVADRLR